MRSLGRGRGRGQRRETPAAVEKQQGWSPSSGGRWENTGDLEHGGRQTRSRGFEWGTWASRQDPVAGVGARSRTADKVAAA